jgi:hypothetical protein
MPSPPHTVKQHAIARPSNHEGTKPRKHGTTKPRKHEKETLRVAGISGVRLLFMISA